MNVIFRAPVGLVLLSIVSCLAGSGRALAQLSTDDEQRLQILSDPDAVKKKLEKEKARAPFEFFRSQVAPNDVLPYVKPHQWSSMTLEVRANYDDYEGILQSFPVPLAGMPQEIVFAREARMVKEQRARLGLQILLPELPKDKEMNFEIVRPGSVRPDEVWQASVRPLSPHQMLVLVLSKDSTNQYAGWSRLPATVPGMVERADAMAIDQLRYYRLVLPLDPVKPVLSPHPLTWGTISHIVWDALPPETISVSHQQAMLDWLHWGGQLVVIGGAGPNFSILRDSFLWPYLPGEPTGESKLLGEADLRPLSQAYPPNFQTVSLIDLEQGNLPTNEFLQNFKNIGHGYRAPEPIQPRADRPLYVAGLKPRPGATTIPLGEASPLLLAVEKRVGRGRVTMLSINPTDPALAAWPGLDTLVRRVVFRRREENGTTLLASTEPANPPASRAFLEGPDLSWYRILTRDAGAEEHATAVRAAARSQQQQQQSPRFPPSYPQPAQAPPSSPPYLSDDGGTSGQLIGVAEWRDAAPLPRLCRDVLEKASGISVPSSQFVLKVILAYMIAVVPLNWLFFRFLVNRRELAWILVPILALGFAIGVERMAAYDLGYDSACDEVDVLEIHGDYPRAHLSRFASLYTTGRARYTIAYPNDPTALALPFDNGRSISGEDVTTSVWQSYPVPALRGFSVQPRSLAMYRAEQMLNLPGEISLKQEEGRRRVANGSDMELRDAILIDFAGPGERKETYLGKIAPGEEVDIAGRAEGAIPAEVTGFDGPDPNSLLRELRRSWEPRLENVGEIRLVAWIAKPVGGQAFEPELDRHRGMTAVVVHLRHGIPPSPDGPNYNLLASREIKTQDRFTRAPAAAQSRRSRGVSETYSSGSRRPAAPTPGSSIRTLTPGRR